MRTALDSIVTNLPVFGLQNGKYKARCRYKQCVNSYETMVFGGMSNILWGVGMNIIGLISGTMFN